ncbi:hypothetical protein EW026_g1109 [Hermanssonia centrifuga]|uniref:G domain-containing protein n=1 Tax=Hermanssonia centrifuga TaxID=98765 RepID=A0A4S4KX19_9APHY|nr:hypothetical protein EW026_g1109 [Hermanssonia centrifuga]
MLATPKGVGVASWKRSTAPALVRLLKAYRPSSAQSVTVGVVGYPNVGKSSLINSLKRSKACAVAAQPGHTKELQTVQLERGIRIVDSPGVVFDDADDLLDSGGRARVRGSVLLRNVVKVEDVEDPIELVEEILQRSDREALQKIYNLPEFSNTLEFLTMLALITGRLLKGGTPDALASAKVVITDWNHHKIPYFTIPPTIHPSSLPAMTASGEVAPGAEDVGQARIVTELGKAFELGALFQGADEGAFGDQGATGSDEQEVNMDEAEDGMVEDATVSPTAHKRRRSASPTPSVVPSTDANPNNYTKVNEQEDAQAGREKKRVAQRGQEAKRKVGEWRWTMMV